MGVCTEPIRNPKVARHGEPCGRPLPCAVHSVAPDEISATVVAAFVDEQIRLRTSEDGGSGLAQLIAEVAASGRFTEDAAGRLLRRIRSGEAVKVALDTLDELLQALELTELWFTNDGFREAAYRQAAAAGGDPEPVGLRCEDCGKGPLDPDDYRPLDLMRPDPSASLWIWDATKQKPVRRPGGARVGGRRFRKVDLCRLCGAQALRKRAGSTVMENGRRRYLRTSERVPPKRGGRPRLLTDAQLRQAHVVYERGDRSRRQIAAGLVASLGKGTQSGMEQALLYGWRRLGLPTRSRSEAVTIMHRDVLGHEIGRRAAQIAGKRKCSAVTTVYGRGGGRPCGQWAQPGSELCAMHERFGTTPRSERRPRCAATTARGERCIFSPVDGGLCRLHADPERRKALGARMKGTSWKQRPENLTTYATVQPRLRAYVAWAAQQPRPADQTTGRPPTWRWLVEALEGRYRNTELVRYANGDPEARMLKETAATILAAVDQVLGEQRQLLAA